MAAANPGCALQITAHTERLGRALPVLHPMELLARSIALSGDRTPHREQRSAWTIATVVALTTASIAEMDARHGGDPGSGAPPRAEDFLPPAGAFLLARLDGRPSGCGGFSRFDDATAELRRMYVVPEARGAAWARRWSPGCWRRPATRATDEFDWKRETASTRP